VKKAKSLRLILCLILVAVELVPIGVVITNSFKRDIDIWARGPLYLKPTLKSYRAVFENSDFRLALKNSLIVATSSMVVSVFFGSMASFGLVRFNFRLNAFLIFLILMLRMVPQITLALPFYILFRNLGLKDTVMGLTVAHTSFNLPYVIALLLPFFASIPKEYEEAARVDGCRPFSIYWRIFFPLAAPGVVVAAVFAFLMSWNEFLYALVLSGPRSKTAPIVVNAFLGQYAPLWGQLSAGATIMLIPVFAITLGFQKYIVKGLSSGGLKG